MNKKQKKVLKRIIITAVLLAVLMVFEEVFLAETESGYRFGVLGEFFDKYGIILLPLYLVPYGSGNCRSLCAERCYRR